MLWVSVMSRWLSIIGLGEEGVEGLSPSARALLSGAGNVFGGTRHLALAAPIIRGKTHPWPSPIADAWPALLALRGRPVAVLASGDPFCFGIGSSLGRIVPMGETFCIPAPSSFALACARLGWAGQEVGALSFCGRPLAALRPWLQPGARLLLLSADATTPGSLASYLRDHGFGPSRMHVLEALGGPRERIRSFASGEAASDSIDPLNLVALEVAADQGARVLSLAAGLPDDLFEHDGQITKREIRAVTLAALAPRQGECLWDIGCGSGSVGIEWMLRHPANRAIAIDPRPDRAARAARNAVALGVPGLSVVEGRAPGGLDGLPPPDAVFIGGGATHPGVIDAAWTALRPGGRLVANAVSIETEMALASAWRERGGEMTRLRVERLDQLGAMHGFRPGMTVTQWAAVKS